MSFIQNTTGRGYAPGWFLAEADCARESVTVAANHAQVVTLADGTKIVPAGAVIPSNDGNAKGLLYEDVEVTTGNMPGSLVTRGKVYESRLPASVQSAAKAVLTGIGFATLPDVTRPDFGPNQLEEITVVSAAGTAAGDTALTLSEYTPGSGESYVYKVATGTAPAIAYGAIPDYSWTPWNGSSDITAATGTKITVASVDANGRAVAAGSATVTAKS